MAQEVIVDTDILIDFGRDIPAAVQTMQILEQKYRLGISVIVGMELLTGCRSKKDLKNVDDFLKGFYIHFLTEEISRKAFEWMRKFRSSHGVEINDMLIAATAFSTNSKFISKNQKHYKFLPNLDLLEYPLRKL